jgi:uncharacterized protein
MRTQNTNAAEAIKWFRLAAAQGNMMAGFALGQSYELGKGKAQDYVHAHMWYNLSGASSANAVKERDRVASKMTPQHIAEAQKLAREC